MSRLYGVQVANSMMLTVRDHYAMERIEAAMIGGRNFEVIAYHPGIGEERRYIRERLHLDNDVWGVRKIFGYILESDEFVRVTLHDNPRDADPLNLK